MALVDLARRLLDASKAGDENQVTYLMASGAPFTTDWLGTSPLHMACRNGHKSTAEVLLRAGVSRDARTKVDQTPLHVSCMAGHLNIVEMLLSHSASVNATDMLKMTPLHWAVERGHTEIAQALIKHGADMLLQNKFDKTPLDIALDKENHEIIQLFKKKELLGPDNDLPTQVVLGPIPAGTTRVSLDQSSEISLANIRPVDTITVNKGLFTQNPGSSTSVLATLAALAEASTPLNKSPSGSGLQWLDGSVPHGSQTLILTDAGKLALGVKSDEGTTLEIKGDDTVTLGLKTTDEETIEVKADGTASLRVHDVETTANMTPLSEERPSRPRKKQRTEDIIRYTPSDFHEDDEKEEDTLKLLPSSSDSDTLTIICADGEMTIEGDSDKGHLQRQLELARKEAEEFKQQLALKEQEAENYKQKLEEMNGAKDKGSKKSPRKQTLETRNSGKS